MKQKYLIATFALFTILGLVIAPQHCIASVNRSLDLCMKVIIPSLFPFFVCSRLLIESGFVNRLGRWCSIIMRPVFNVPGCGSFALLIGLISGYPVGAKCAVSLYRQNLCTKAEAERILCFCNNSGPLFIIGSVAIAMLYSPSAGIILYSAHVLSAISVGIVFRFYKKTEKVYLNPSSNINRKNVSIGEGLSAAITESVSIILYVCGFIIFFGVFVSILDKFGIIAFISGAFATFGVPKDISAPMVYGFFEITGGIAKLCALPIGNLKLVLISAIMAWSGVSVILQVNGIIAKTDLSKTVFIAAKALQSLFAAVYTLILIRLPATSIAVFAQATPKYTVSGSFAYTLLLMIIAILFYGVLSAFCFLFKCMSPD